MKRLIFSSIVLFASLASSAELAVSRPTVIEAPADGGTWTVMVSGKPATFSPFGQRGIIPSSAGWNSVTWWPPSGQPLAAVVLVGGAAPVIGPTAEITATPSTIKPNGKSLLAWTTARATSATLNGVQVGLVGQMEYAPQQTTEYVLVATDGQMDATAKTTVVVDGTGPQPPPVRAEKVRATVLIEEGERTVEQARAFSDPALKAWIKDGGHQWREIDEDVVDAAGNVPKELAPLLDESKKVGLPTLCMEDLGGKVTAKVIQLPSSGAAILAELKKYGGKP